MAYSLSALEASVRVTDSGARSAWATAKVTALHRERRPGNGEENACCVWRIRAASLHESDMDYRNGKP